MSLRALIRLLLLLVPFSICRPQSPPAAILSSGDLLADASLLRRAYEELHPGLYRYSSKAEMNQAFTTLNESLGRDQTLADAFIHFAQFAARIRCGHTQANPFNQSKAVVQSLFHSRTRLPFYFEWLNRAMIVTRDFTPARQIPPGSEVVRINGIPASTILAQLLSIARADGSNDAKRTAELGLNGGSDFETFDLYYPLFFPSEDARYRVEVKAPSTKQTSQLTVAALTPEERLASRGEQQNKRGSEALFEWKDLNDRVGYLKMPTWALYNSKWDWNKWLQEHLNEAAARADRALVIDLRGNEGGNDIGNAVIAHLIDKPLRTSSMQRLVRYRKVPEDLAKYLDTWDKSFLDWGNSAVDLKAPWPTAPAGISYLKLARAGDDAGEDVILPAKKRFRGKVIVLIDASNSSATFQFAQAMQLNKLGTLVGQTTGGSQRGINGGAFFFVRLPRSGIEMDLPLIGTFADSSKPDSGVKPDVSVPLRASDLASGKDVVLERALQMAR